MSGFFATPQAAAVLKHGILRRYLPVFATKTGSRSGEVVYLDGYAGPGLYDDGTEGSPALALQTAAAVADSRSRAAEVLGVGRSTAYELVRSGDLKCIRLRRRIVIPVAHLAERLGVERADVWAMIDQAVAPEPSPPSDPQSSWPRKRAPEQSTTEHAPTLF